MGFLFWICDNRKSPEPAQSGFGLLFEGFVIVERRVVGKGGLEGIDGAGRLAALGVDLADVELAPGRPARIGVGHGMGVEGHEAPWLAPGDTTSTGPGMVFSCEPGVYRPNMDGWRTIDTLIVGPDGVEVASRFQMSPPLETRTLPC